MSVLCCLYRCIFVAVTSVGIDLTLNTGRLFTSGLYLSKFLLDIPPRWTTSRAGRNVQSLQRVVGFQPVRGKQLVTLSFFHEGHSWHACQEKMCCLWANWRQRQQEWQSDVCGRSALLLMDGLLTKRYGHSACGVFLPKPALTAAFLTGKTR